MRPKHPPERFPRGIRRQPDGTWRVYGSAINPRGASERFWKRLPATYTKSQAIAYRDARLTEIRTGIAVVSDRTDPTFAEDARRYLDLPQVRDMPSFADREDQIDNCVSAFDVIARARKRPPYTRAEIAADPNLITQALALLRKKKNPNEKLSPASVMRHRTALMSVWTTLDGRAAANPVKNTPKMREGDDAPLRVQPYAVWEAIHDQIGAYFHRGAASKRRTRARFRLMMWTGWPHAVIKRLDFERDIDWGASRVYVRQRRKGKGVTGRWIAILPQAKAALEECVRVGATGPFSNSAMHSAVMRAIDAENKARRERGVAPLPPRIRPYDVRHSFGTLMALVIKDDRALGELLIHASKAMVRRYTELATEPRTAGAIAELAAALQSGAALASLQDAVGNFGNFSQGSPGATGAKVRPLKLVKGARKD